MTRINLIDPSELTDQHLVAEYREICRMPATLLRTIQSKSGIVKAKIPTNFTLNTGHVYFFYDKGKYLFDRFNQLVREMQTRGFATNLQYSVDKWPTELYHDWIPSEQDKEIIRERISEKIKMKPHFYRYRGNPIQISD